MNSRKLAFEAGLSTLQRPRFREKRLNMSAASDKNGLARAGRYNARGMALPLNEITNGDSIALLNAQPEGWVDLVFADPPFNIGYLYHGYDDQKDVNEYVNWSEQWMRAVHRALKPNGSFYLAIGDEFAADL